VVAAALAWIFAVCLLGYTHRVFAAISAIVCLSPELRIDATPSLKGGLNS